MKRDKRSVTYTNLSKEYNLKNEGHIPSSNAFLLSTTWQLDLFQAHFISTYGLISLVISLVMVAGCTFVYYRYRYDRIRQIIHRQKLAKMILENGWYETKQVQ